MGADTGPRVAVVGVGQSVHRPGRTDVGYAELVHEAIVAALADAGVGLADIENAVTASLDFWDGRTISNMAIAEVVGSYLKSEARVCGDATAALVYQWARIRAGGFRLGLVVAHCKESEGRPHDIEAAAFDPYLHRRLDPDGDVVAGLAAQRFYAVTGYTDRDCAAAVVAARRAGRHNPTVTLAEVTVDDVLASPPLATPLRELDKAVAVDGSCALVLAGADLVPELGVAPVWVTGVASGTDRYWLDRDLASVDVLARCARTAQEMAGWNGAVPDVVEISAQFGFQLLQFAPAFGAPAGPAGEAGVRPAVNPSGGWLAGNPLVVTGLSRVAECVHQLRGTAGDRQVTGARRALAHGTSGLGAQSHGVIALEGDG